MMHVQKQDVQLPPGQWIDTWTLTRNIAKAFHPSLRNTMGIYCVVGKRLIVEVKPDPVDLDLPYPVSTEDLDELSPLLKDLPQLRESMTDAELIVFMAAYDAHPARPPWTPVIATYEDVRRANNLLDLFQQAHRVEMQTAVDQGNLVIVDRRHLLKSEIGMDVFITRDAAHAYLQQRGMRYEKADSAPAALGEKPGLEFQSTSEAASDSLLGSSIAATLQAQAPTETSPKEDIASDSEQEIGSVPLLAIHPQSTPDQPGSSMENESCESVVTPDREEITKAPEAKLASRASSKSLKGNLPSLPDDAPIGSEGGPQKRQPRIILRLRQVEAQTGLSGSAIYDKLKTTSPRFDATFPKQMKIGSERVGWIESEIDAWIESKMSSRMSAVVSKPLPAPAELVAHATEMFGFASVVKGTLLPQEPVQLHDVNVDDAMEYVKQMRLAIKLNSRSPIWPLIVTALESADDPRNTQVVWCGLRELAKSQKHITLKYDIERECMRIPSVKDWRDFTYDALEQFLSRYRNGLTPKA